MWFTCSAGATKHLAPQTAIFFVLVVLFYAHVFYNRFAFYVFWIHVFCCPNRERSHAAFFALPTLCYIPWLFIATVPPPTAAGKVLQYAMDATAVQTLSWQPQSRCSSTGFQCAPCTVQQGVLRILGLSSQWKRAGSVGRRHSQAV